MRRLGRVLMLVAAAALAAACLVDVSHVSDPGDAFAEARRQAEAARGSEGPPDTLNVLAFDPDEEELVRVRVPIGMVRLCDNDDVDLDIELDPKTRERIRRHAGRDLRLEDLAEAGLGILVEVNDDDGERVLIWLS